MATALTLCWNFFCVNVNAKFDLENTQIMHYILCYKKWHTPKLLDELNCKSKGENNGKIRSWACSLAHNTLRVEGAWWSFGMGIKKSDKRINYLHKPAQTKVQVGQCIVGTLLVHGRTMSKHELTRLTTTWTWGKLLPSPFNILYTSPWG